MFLKKFRLATVGCCLLLCSFLGALNCKNTMTMADLQTGVAAQNVEVSEKLKYLKLEADKLKELANYEEISQISQNLLPKFRDFLDRKDLPNSPNEFCAYMHDFVLNNSFNGSDAKNIKTMSAADFEELAKDKDSYSELFRGVPTSDMAVKTRAGEAWISGSKEAAGMGLLGNCLYTSMKIDVAKEFKNRKYWGSDGQGEVVRFLISKKAKMITQEELVNAIKLMVLNNANYFEEYLRNYEIYGDIAYYGGLYTPQYNYFRNQVEFVKKHKNFDFFDLSKGSAAERHEELKRLFEDLTRNNAEKLKEFEDLCSKRIDYCKDLGFGGGVKQELMLRNLGLLAQLLGYDAIISNDHCSEVDVVNFKELIVCADKFDDEAK